MLAYPRRVYLVGVSLIVAAGGLEWAQNFVPGRDGRLEDFLFKAAGLIVGLVVARLVQLALCCVACGGLVTFQISAQGDPTLAALNRAGAAATGGANPTL